MAEATLECSHEVDIQAIIREVMAEYGVSPEQIP